MSSTRIVDRNTWLRVRPAMSKEIVSSPGRGGPVPVDPQKQKPIKPAVQLPNPLAGLQQSLADLTSGISNGFQAATKDVLGGGEVLVGVALIIGGLLVATGQAGRLSREAARLGLGVATRGAIR